jgi:hypothetical protein
MTIRNVAIMMLMVILIMPAAVHAHTLELLRAETSHAVGGGCHDADNDADQDPTGNQQSDVRCCELDTPYVLPSAQYLTNPAVTGVLVCPFNCRQLDGYSRRIYKPPR